MEKRKSESVQKSINTNKEKYAIDETENEEPLVTDNPAINEQSYLTYSIVVKTSRKILMPCVNKHAWKPQGTGSIRKYAIP